MPINVYRFRESIHCFIIIIIIIMNNELVMLEQGSELGCHLPRNQSVDGRTPAADGQRRAVVRLF